MGERTKTAVIYARVSTARQAEEALPVESQIDQCRVKAAALGAQVVKVFRDDGISGRTSKRPAFQAAIDHCELARIDYFVCWSTSRFARNRLDAALHKRLLEKIGTRLVYASQDFGDNDDAWLAEAIVEVMDEQYSRTIAKDTRRSMAKNAAEGFWNGGHVPYGFRVVPDGKRRRLAPCDAEAPAVQLVFRWYLEGSGCKDIATRLNESGISRRGRQWNKNAVASLITSPAMVGRSEWSDRGELISAQSHQAIVDEADWMLARELMGARAPRNAGGTPRSAGVFSGMLRCECGTAMMTETATGRRGVRYHYYNCRAFLKGEGCSSHRVSVSDVDGVLLDAILERVFTVENLRSIVIELKMQRSELQRSRQSMIDALAAEEQDVSRRLRRMYELIEGDAGLNIGDVAPRLRELRERQESIRREVAAIDAEPGEYASVSDADIVRAAETFKDVVRSSDDPAKVRQFLAGIVKQASFDGDKIRVEYWPECVANAVGGSHCGVIWLPDPATLRTETMLVEFWASKKRRVA